MESPLEKPKINLRKVIQEKKKKKPQKKKLKKLKPPVNRKRN
jgi:hypothetical protein